MFEMKAIISRQKPSQYSKSSMKLTNIYQMPFYIERHSYKQLVVYEKRGHWSEKQKLKYAVFLDYYKNRFQIKAKRRFNNIFDIMSTFIKTRNSHQCRSHHQKMEKQKFKIDSIITNTSSKYHPRVYKQLKQRYINQIQALHLDESQNFEKFKERMERIEQKKAVQRQTIAHNRRILRSSKANEKAQEKNYKKLMKNRKKLEQLKTHQKNLLEKKEENGNEINIKKQEDDYKIEGVLRQKIQNQQLVTVIPSFNQNQFQRQLDQFAQNMNKNQLRFIQKIQMLENQKKQHLDLAYMHYNEYMKHVNEANNIQFEIIKQNSIRGTIQNY